MLLKIPPFSTWSRWHFCSVKSHWDRDLDPKWTSRREQTGHILWRERNPHFNLFRSPLELVAAGGEERPRVCRMYIIMRTMLQVVVNILKVIIKSRRFYWNETDPAVPRVEGDAGEELVSVQNGQENVTLACSAVGKPRPSLEWGLPSRQVFYIRVNMWPVNALA